MQRFKEQYETKQANLISQLMARDTENREEIARLKKKLHSLSDSEHSTFEQELTAAQE